MNKILLSKNQYTSISFGNTDKHSEMQYRIFTNKVKLKQKKYTNVLVYFVNKFNTFVMEKFNDKQFIIAIDNKNVTQDTDINSNIYNLQEELNNLEIRIDRLLFQKGIKHWPNYTSFNISGTNFELRANFANYQKIYFNNMQPYIFNKQQSLFNVRLFSPIVKFRFNLTHYYEYLRIYNWSISWRKDGEIKTNADIILSI